MQASLTALPNAAAILSKTGFKGTLPRSHGLDVVSDVLQ